ncbi:MAG: endonuclease/exonuclease/phosphatase family protein [Saprospiraceae bacterium]|nr:endonuclease/exonuclease/phosphatase family protein [Saprospiraceae bacterium]
MGCKSVKSQSIHKELISIAFYNLENLFDTNRDTSIFDEEFTPNGAKQWTEEKYRQKLENISKVLSELARKKTPSGPAIIGVCEIENREVLRDLLNTDLLNNSPYQIVHKNSMDARGIDVALLYNPNIFTFIDYKSIPVLLTDSIGSKKYTRDILLVKGKIGNQKLYITVNHWPSRRGGTAITQKFRNKLATINRMLYDSIAAIEPDPAFIVMGDLNDNPSDESVRFILKAQKDIDYVKESHFFNPFYQTYKNGEGTLAHNNSWNLFDQILLSHRLVLFQKNEINYDEHQVFHKSYMLETDGHYKNHPKRSFSGDRWNNGYSDHFPTIVYLRLH